MVKIRAIRGFSSSLPQITTMKNLSILLLAFLFFAVKPAKAQAKEENLAKKRGCAVCVDFGSPGSGIDIKKYEEIKKLIDSKKLEMKETPNGREGELYMCLKLTELSKKKKKAFIKELKKTADGGQLVTVTAA
jgi:hypothetical protein